LSVAVVSITSTKRKRFLWAAWWTGAPTHHPFRKPDASNGGASTQDQALREAEKSAGRSLNVVEPKWARAWNRILRGMPPWTPRDLAQDAKPSPRTAEAQGTPSAKAASDSIWTVLGLSPSATVAEIKTAFRKRALLAHPDHGGDPADFRNLQAAYREALRRREKSDKRPKKRA
jgi:hypothetical protein